MLDIWLHVAQYEPKIRVLYKKSISMLPLFMLSTVGQALDSSAYILHAVKCLMPYQMHHDFMTKLGEISSALEPPER